MADLGAFLGGLLIGFLACAWALGPELAEARRELERTQDGIIARGDKLSSIVNLIRGLPAPGHLHSTHDAVELVADVVAERDALRAGDGDSLRPGR